MRGHWGDQAPDSTAASLEGTASRVITFGHRAMDSDESGEDKVSEVKGFTRKFDSGRRLVSFGPARKAVRRGLDEKRSNIHFIPSRSPGHGCHSPVFAPLPLGWDQTLAFWWGAVRGLYSVTTEA